MKKPSTDFQIEPNKMSSLLDLDYTPPIHTNLIGIIPHAHYRGESFKYEIELIKSGRKIEILKIPRFRFDYQSMYYFSKQYYIDLPIKIHVTAIYNNSIYNPFNPNPQQLIKWGPQSFEEMFQTTFVFASKNSLNNNTSELVPEVTMSSLFR